MSDADEAVDDTIKAPLLVPPEHDEHCTVCTVVKSTVRVVPTGVETGDVARVDWVRNVPMPMELLITGLLITELLAMELPIMELLIKGLLTKELPIMEVAPEDRGKGKVSIVLEYTVWIVSTRVEQGVAEDREEEDDILGTLLVDAVAEQLEHGRVCTRVDTIVSVVSRRVEAPGTIGLKLAGFVPLSRGVLAEFDAIGLEELGVAATLDTIAVDKSVFVITIVDGNVIVVVDVDSEVVGD